MIDPAQVVAIASFGVAALALLAWQMAASDKPGPRRARRGPALLPPVDGVRVAGPGAVSTLADLPRHEPEVDSILVRPYVTHPVGLHIGRPDLRPVPSDSPQAARGVALATAPPCICREGRSAGALPVCLWCGCPRGGWSA